MLFLWPGTSKLLRGQGTYLSDDEIDSVTDACSQGEQEFVNELMNLKVKEDEEDGDKPSGLKKRDDLYESAVDIVVREGRGSVSLLQRCLGIGYGRAARLIDYMAEDNIVGPYNGAQAREVNVSVSEWEEMQGMDPDESEGSGPPAEKISMTSARPTGEPSGNPTSSDADYEEEEEDYAEEDEANSEYEYEYDDDEEEEEDEEFSTPAGKFGSAGQSAGQSDGESEDLDEEDVEYEYVYEDDDEEYGETA